MTRPTRLIWTEPMLATLNELYPYLRSHDIAERLGVKRQQVLEKAWRLGLKKTKEAIARMAKLAMDDPNHPGRRHQFQTGQTSWNKGTHFQSGGRSVETQFKPGTAAYNWVPIGSERITKDGYLQRKLTDTGVTYRDFVYVHRIIWHEAGRTIPPNHALIFKDGDKQNITLANLELISRADLMRRNSVHNYGPEIAQLHQLQGVITRRINQRLRQSA